MEKLLTMAADYHEISKRCKEAEDSLHQERGWRAGSEKELDEARILLRDVFQHLTGRHHDWNVDGFELADAVRKLIAPPEPEPVI